MSKLPVSYNKILEINSKFNLVNKNSRVLELGCYPGGWNFYLNSLKKNNFIVGIDLKKCCFNNFIKGNFYNAFTYKKILILFKNNGPNIIVSDLCPKISKPKYANKIIFSKIIAKLFHFVKNIIAKDGSFVFKSMDYLNLNIINNFGPYFLKNKKKKLLSSKKKSAEVYYIFKNFLNEI